MKVYTLLRICGILLFLAVSLPSFSQDIHFSQFRRSPLNLNPALTGVFNGDTRFVGNYRGQWTTVPVNYQTFSGSVDQVIYLNGLRNSRVGVGLVVGHDEAGDLDLDILNIGLNASLTLQLSKGHFLSAGLQGGLYQRSFDQNNVRTDQQWTGDTFEPKLFHGETFSSTSFQRFDFGVGVNWHFQKPEKRTKFDLGLGIFHIGRPKVSFFEDGDIRLNRRFSISGTSALYLVDEVDLLFDAAWQIQGPYDEIIFGPGARIHLNQTRTRETSLDFGLEYRFFNHSDALIPYLALNFRQLTLGLSYDINISEFKVATNNAGGPEVTAVYTITKVRPIPVKICPIF